MSRTPPARMGSIIVSVEHGAYTPFCYKPHLATTVLSSSITDVADTSPTHTVHHTSNPHTTRRRRPPPPLLSPGSPPIPNPPLFFSSYPHASHPHSSSLPTLRRTPLPTRPLPIAPRARTRARTLRAAFLAVPRFRNVRVRGRDL